jgi:WhiB family transcriptional regulator, redox-sensing transcriptional regulator
MGSFVPHGSYFTTDGAKYRRDPGWGMPQPWEEQAACKDTSIELWFGEEHPFGVTKAFRTKEQTERAKAICARCPVLDDCREWVMEVQLPFGIVAAMTEVERKQLSVQDQTAWQKFWRQQDEATGRRRVGQDHNRRKTHCNHGHEYTPENTYRSGGKRFCLACQKRRTAEYRVRKRKELGHWPWEDWPSTKQRQNGHLTG